MKNAAITLTFASLLLTGTPVLAANPVEPSDKTPGVTPNDARMPLPSFESYYAPYYGFGPYYAPYYGFGPYAPYYRTGASDPYTPNPHRNTPGAEAKD
jgi:hypothetical protein